MAEKIKAEVRKFLEEPRFAVLATLLPDGTPHQAVLWYELQGDEVLLNTQVTSQKAVNLKRSMKASICVEDGYRYATLYGEMKLVEDPQVAVADLHRLARRYTGQDAGPDLAHKKRVSLRFKVDRVQTNI